MKDLKMKILIVTTLLIISQFSIAKTNQVPVKKELTLAQVDKVIECSKAFSGRETIEKNFNTMY